ncbi:Transient receptor potential cation channel subfamily A member 1 [Nymphon striatum]|nr:Transient receptor potential cation channel subfamily A member 1 [Nymphon striatum]
MHGVVSYLRWMRNIPRRSNRLNNMNNSKADHPLLKNGNELEIVQNDQWNTELFETIKAGNAFKMATMFQMADKLDCLQDYRGRKLLHFATESDIASVIDMVLTYCPDLNVTDIDGNTALHVAVMAEKSNSIQHLIQKGAETNILNSKCYGPLHLAVVLNRPLIVANLLAPKQVDGCAVGAQGRTALHFACIHDYYECVNVLFMGVFINFTSCQLDVAFPYVRTADKYGITKRRLMNVHDAEGNTPLHAAIHGGNVKAIEICLKNGACICQQQHDKSTPLHLACSRGSLEIVRILLHEQNQMVLSKCLSLEDAQHRTPLHMAAMFNHPDLVKYLVAEGGDLEHYDIEERTPLLLAAVHQAWDSVILLMQLGAKITVTEINNRNIFHLMILNKGCVNYFKSKIIAQNATVQKLLNDKDNEGCSPIHLATRSGRMKCIECLILQGVDINCKNKEDQSPLHFAAKYGRLNTVRQLINSDKHMFLINDTDKNGNTPLHLASENGHVKVISLLLSKGAIIARNHRQQTALHRAAINGYTYSAKVLLRVHGFLLDKQDKDGNTALHYAVQHEKVNVVDLLLHLKCSILKNQKELNPIDFAIQNKNVKAMRAMVTHPSRKQDIMQTEIKNYDNVYHALIASMPCVMKTVLDLSITKSEGLRIDSVNFSIKYNFECLENKCLSQGGEPLPILNVSTVCPQPVANDFTTRMSYGMASTLLGLLVYLIFLITLTMFILNVTDVPLFDQVKNVTPPMKWKYFADPVNYIEVTLYTLTPIVLMSADDYQKGDTQLFLAVSSIAIFIAWFISLLYLQRILAMMLGELDFVGSFIKPYIAAESNNVVQVKLAMAFFVLFGILVPCLLVNLLIGLAVGDIETVRKNALLKALAMQVEIHTDLEQRLPKRLLNKVHKKELEVYPNISCEKNKQIKSVAKVVALMMANSIFENNEDDRKGEHYSVAVQIQLEKQKANQDVIEGDDYELAGLTCVGVGAWLVRDSDFADIAGNIKDGDIFTGAYVLIGVGGTVFIVAMIGCCGAFIESKCMILTPYVFLENILSQEVLDYRTNEDSRTFLDTIQEKMRCCGVNSYSDYLNANTTEPRSCSDVDTHATYKTGCAAKIWPFISQLFVILGGIASGVGIFQVSH